MGGGTALTRRFAPLCAAMILLAISIACGGNATPRSTPATVSPEPTAAVPTPLPTPTVTPTTANQYQVTLFSGTDAHGQVTVDATGNVTMQVTGGTASTNYAAQFCPFPSTRYSCFALGSLSTDAAGAGSTTFHFPTPGTWSGDFTLTGGSSVFSTQVAGNIGQVFFATLEPANMTNGQGIGRTANPPSTAQESGSGTLTVSGGTVHVVLNGAPANTTYAVVQCFPSDGPGCFQIGPFDGNTFTTDASGNATFNAPSAGIPGDFFSVGQLVTSATATVPAGFAAGFKSQ